MTASPKNSGHCFGRYNNIWGTLSYIKKNEKYLGEGPPGLGKSEKQGIFLGKLLLGENKAEGWKGGKFIVGPIRKERGNGNRSLS